jgi:hypothetical protein
VFSLSEEETMTSVQDNKKKTAGRLKSQLEDYSAAAKAGATKATLRQRMGNWPVYAAATGSALAMTTSASAGIIYSGRPAIITSTGTHHHASTTVNLQSLSIHLYIFQDLSHAHAPGLVARASAKPLGGANLGGMKNLVSGAVISSRASGFTSGQGVMKSIHATDHGVSSFGNWAAGVPGFEGFRFAAAHGQTDYGWAELEYGIEGDGIQDSVTLLGLAYDDTGGSITAGEMAPTPEPGTAGMMLLALGAAGVTALRKRKKAS